MTHKNKSAWPTKKVMEQIYDKNLWGGEKSEFYSGLGSHSAELIEPYLIAVKKFLVSFEKPPVICDLGCGDFNVGQHLIEHAQKYIAIDIVPSLIERNRNKYTAANLEFLCLDISIDELPEADCIIIRQVLQHLSNNEIQRILKKLTRYKYIIVTEHIPLGEFIPNIDIISGQGIRLKKKSGVNILAPPFNFSVKEQKILWAISVNNSAEVINTMLYSL